MTEIDWADCHKRLSHGLPLSVAEQRALWNRCGVAEEVVQHDRGTEPPTIDDVLPFIPEPAQRCRECEGTGELPPRKTIQQFKAEIDAGFRSDFTDTKGRSCPVCEGTGYHEGHVLPDGAVSNDCPKCEGLGYRVPLSMEDEPYVSDTYKTPCPSCGGSGTEKEK